MCIRDRSDLLYGVKSCFVLTSEVDKKILCYLGEAILFRLLVVSFLFVTQGMLSQDGSFLMQDYFSEFEIQRLNFSIFGCLKQMNGDHKVMMICGEVMVRRLLGELLLVPTDVLPDIKFTPRYRENIKVLASLIYLLCMEIMKELPANPKSQEHVLENIPINRKGGVATYKTNASKTPLDANGLLETGKSDPTKTSQSTSENIIEGLYGRADLKTVLLEHATEVKMMIRSIKDTCKSILGAVNSFWIADYRYNSGQDELMPLQKTKQQEAIKELAD
eukprot:TRINITY_DN2321_c0_g2_i2.p1 TRINITY_DN2321_c0_g2~~TRINITY_DN2321_c0_g2_i2.p1  ORF type:complete len:295 (-),score=38.46 TRINITY_DN2321_c0_g2_i2:142-969(-)